ncbi:sterol desaturase family protein [Pigmentiphaga kullae]|uniref:Sterol desaturase/sphingolipid hydroxylase (Fatty acid hydroxylase superfamily) n=1 Tax=Pigmentiphaga kullae TaxID=151784 RepID=A0A4V2F341_9BURK|nr:sterol desaturase family protein [Pigmentiphaga kullae]RZS81074.1 sterol desaturase/sphingolipid hydroxylase (fatty acid hydroxylase superfamily) [Pigmentiphaga kullae]
MELLSDLFSGMQQWLFETLVQPLLFHLGLGSILEDAYDGTMWLLLGVLQLIIMLAVFGPLQRWRPVEKIVDRASVRLDILYTAIHSLGLFRLVLFFTTQPLADHVFGQLHVLGFSPFHLDEIWPGVTDRAWVSLILYLLIFDFVDYAFHRAEHRYQWLWALHAVHHSQRQMTMWSDNRNHLLSDLLRDAVVVLVSHLVGVPPGQFVMVVVITRLVESLSHANLRTGFGRIGQYLIVGPKFHRHHHAIEPPPVPGRPEANYNFGVLFPIWDILLRTARFDGSYGPTGISDQLPERGGRDYGRGFLAQQWLGLKRLLGGAPGRS